MSHQASDDDVIEALRFLNHFAATTSADARITLPGLHRVHVLHRGQGGWVRLAFFDYTPDEALVLARQLLLPEPEAVDPRDADVAFEGVPGVEPEPPAGVTARIAPRPSRPPAMLRAGDPTSEPT
jgi:hypothetical protein